MKVRDIIIDIRNLSMGEGPTVNLATFGMSFFLYLWICGFKVCSLVFAEKV